MAERDSFYLLPMAGKRWTDSGEAHDRRGRQQPAHREPIPPPLIREHMKTFGRTENSRPLRRRQRPPLARATHWTYC
ncbi:hypothetical protein TU94_22215 [Streptomyces cyaneogriseus subsp. noncyanogenus]|uniref:Uncharacterized protein n=1 Tax=Streptomyces cyaneogriseus subsp. noncyanogenus TaxID=477245 RepID=A0A0C5G1C3_9ACTN|nr:hypothetical protein TU94_22215 [Streptomyces cyaneogriseus subsp. noncyanogenus]